jgi:hypothetical protein
MSCCGQKRQAWRQAGAPAPQARPSPPPVLQNPTVLSYQGDSSLVIKGSVTGFIYLFAARGELGVDERDAPAFQATSLFR